MRGRSVAAARFVVHDSRTLGAANRLYRSSDRRCLGIDPEVFFPIGEPGKTVRRICQGCPVVVDCLTWALATNATGYWGGTSEADRERIRRRGVAA